MNQICAVRDRCTVFGGACEGSSISIACTCICSAGNSLSASLSHRRSAIWLLLPILGYGSFTKPNLHLAHLVTVGRREYPVMTYAPEWRSKYVQGEQIEEVDCLHSHLAVLATLPVVLPVVCHHVVRGIIQDTRVADRHSVCVPADVSSTWLTHLGRRTAVDAPAFSQALLAATLRNKLIRFTLGWLPQMSGVHNHRWPKAKSWSTVHIHEAEASLVLQTRIRGNLRFFLRYVYTEKRGC